MLALTAKASFGAPMPSWGLALRPRRGTGEEGYKDIKNAKEGWLKH